MRLLKKSHDSSNTCMCAAPEFGVARRTVHDAYSAISQHSRARVPGAEERGVHGSSIASYWYGSFQAYAPTVCSEITDTLSV